MPMRPLNEVYPFKAKMPTHETYDLFRKANPRVKCVRTRNPKVIGWIFFKTALGLERYNKWLMRMEWRKHTTAEEAQAIAKKAICLNRRKEDQFLGTDISLTMSKADWEEVEAALADQICWNNGFEAARPDSNNGLIATTRLSELHRRIKTILRS